MIAVCRIGLLLFAILAILAPPATAKEIESWNVDERLEGDDGEKSRDVSGIACTEPDGFPRSCLVIDDNRRHAQFVTVKDGELVAGQSIQLIDDIFKRKKKKPKPLELDGEGVAFSDGFYYVIGSHGRPRNTSDKSKKEIAARKSASSQIVRFRAADGVKAVPERTAALGKIIARVGAFAEVAENDLQDNGVTIEGVAVRRGQLLAGFRGPVVGPDHDRRAVILSAPVEGLFEGRMPAHELFRLPLGGLGVRDLALYRDNILILAGPMRAGPGRYAVYSWNGKGEEVRLLGELDGFSDNKLDRKPEALLPLDRTSSGRLRVLILSDGNDAKEGVPTPVEIDAPPD